MTKVTGQITATTLTYSAATFIDFIPNGGFETGDFTYWTPYLSPDNQTITTEEKSSGTYSLKHSHDGTTSVEYFTETIRDYDDLAFSANKIIYYKINIPEMRGVDSLVMLSVDDGLNPPVANYYSATTDGWVSGTLDCSAIMGGYLEIITRVLDESSGKVTAYFDDIKIDYACNGPLASATIEDSLKSWSEDQFNDGIFLITSGKVKGFSFKIEDTFSNYISVPTEFPCENVIKNITSASTVYGNYENFESGATTWTKDPQSEMYGYIDFESMGPSQFETVIGPHSGNYCARIGQFPE